MSGAEEYARWVVKPGNERETGRLVKLAAQRFLNDLTRTDIYFDEDEAVKMPLFGGRYCYQWEGEWRDQLVKFELWQRFIYEQAYGWFWTDSKLRRFEEVYVQIAKKNGKSTMCAVDINFHLLADDRINTPKIYTGANNEEQAKICVNMAGRIIERSPDLMALVDEGAVKLTRYGENITTVIHEEKNGFVKAFAKESGDKKLKTSGGKHGVNASKGIIDEYGMSPDHGAAKPIKTSMASRSEGQMFYITTAGFNLDGPCYQELRKIGIQVLEGVIKKDNYLPVIFEIDKPVGEDGKTKDITAEYLLENEWVWKHANPNIDVSVKRKFLKSALEDAITFGGTTMVDNLTLNFNIWMDSAEVFIPAEAWNKNTHGITEKDLEGAECFGGIEIVSGKHLNCFCLLFPDVKGKTVLKPIFWMPDEYRKNRETDSYNNWVKEGYITTFLGNTSDNDKVFDLIVSYLERYNMMSFAFKTNLVNSDIVQALIKNGYTGNPISHGYQGISTPTLTWEEMLLAGEMEHFNNPVLTWMNSNCLAVRKDHDIRLEKSGSRVVGIYAALNALAEWKTDDANGIQVDTVFTEL
jgi:phage terminase large subunit-like protein